MADRSEAIVALLRAKGGRMTSSRRVIIEVLLSGDAHLTADAIAEAVQRHHPDIHRSTVYRTLDTLTELGVVTHVHLGHGPSVFHLADEDHHHLVCSRCGGVIELPTKKLAALKRTIERDYRFRLDPAHFALGGSCAACSD